MQPRCANQRNHALTLVEVLLIITILAVLAAAFLPALVKPRRHASRINCNNNLHQIAVAFKVWEPDQSDFFPMQVPIVKGGAMKPSASGNVAAIFQVMSNELSTPKILICPADTNRVTATNFSSGVGNKNVSYFVGVDAADAYPQRILSGDDNLSVGGNQVKSGLLELLTNTPVSWTAARHRFVGNIVLADGSVQQTTSSNLNQWLRQTGLATNRLALP
jgi:competence protein ComGC